jgi:hypothetical protein
VASTFVITAAFPSQRATPAGDLYDVIEASGHTLPHEVAFSVTVRKEGDWKATLAELAAAEAAELESLFEL